MPDIKFTTEGEENWTLAFLDTLTVIKPDGNLEIKIYRRPKPTHTDQYLNFSSNHPVQHIKLGVIQTLFYRAESVITDPVTQEKKHTTEALTKCSCPTWAFERVNNPKTLNNPSKDSTGRSRELVVIPYGKGVSEALSRIYGNYGVQTGFKPTRTLRQTLVALKDIKAYQPTL